MAALECGRTGAQVGDDGAAAIRLPTTVASAAAGRFGAAFDIVGRARAAVGDVLSASARALGCRDTDTWRSTVTGARAVDDRSLQRRVGEDDIGTQEGRNREDGEELHLDECRLIVRECRGVMGVDVIYSLRFNRARFEAGRAMFLVGLLC